MIPQSRFGSRIGIGCIYLMAWTIFCCFLIVGCGGGSGGSSGGGPNNITYSGLTSPAEISEDNVHAIAANALESSTSAGGFTGIASLESAGQTIEESYQPFLKDVTTAMKGAIEQIDFGAAPDQYLPAVVQPVDELIYGNCGGNASFSAMVDTETGSFSGSISFNGICNDGMTLNGPANFSGILNPNTSELESFTLTFNYVTGTSATESYTMDGRVDFIKSGATIIGTMGMAIQDNNLDRTCKVEDYQLVITDGYGQTEIEVSGKFYDPEYGYVVLETESTLVYSDTDDYPSSGVVILTGELGASGGATKARLTALSATQCQVEADTNGDESYDYDSGPILWTDLNNPV